MKAYDYPELGVWKVGAVQKNKKTEVQKDTLLTLMRYNLSSVKLGKIDMLSFSATNSICAGSINLKCL